MNDGVPQSVFDQMLASAEWASKTIAEIWPALTFQGGGVEAATMSDPARCRVYRQEIGRLITAHAEAHTEWQAKLWDDVSSSAEIDAAYESYCDARAALDIAIDKAFRLLSAESDEASIRAASGT